MSRIHMEDTVFLPVTELSRRIESGVLDPRALARAYLERADTVGRPLNCYVALCGERAMAEADMAAQRAERTAPAILSLRLAPRCEAKTRRRTQCQSKAANDKGRCARRGRAIFRFR